MPITRKHQEFIRLRKNGTPLVEIAKRLGVSRASLVPMRDEIRAAGLLGGELGPALSAKSYRVLSMVRAGRDLRTIRQAIGESSTHFTERLRRLRALGHAIPDFDDEQPVELDYRGRRYEDADVSCDRSRLVMIGKGTAVFRGKS